MTENESLIKETLQKHIDLNPVGTIVISYHLDNIKDFEKYQLRTDLIIQTLSLSDVALMKTVLEAKLHQAIDEYLNQKL